MIGNKATNLIRLRDEFGVTVPDFLVIPFEAIIDQSTKKAAVLPGSLNELHQQLTEKGWQKVSFRTSAASEDGQNASFAGQYDSFVDITYTKAALKKYILACFQSTRSESVQHYAKRHNVSLEAGGSVIIQEMFYGTSSGVLFSEDGRGRMHVVYSNSWKNIVVDNDSAQEVYLQKNILKQSTAPEYMKQLAMHASTLERAYKTPVDIEWSYNGKTLAFLQVRPQTTPQLDYSLTWDSTNISENYPGITLPLTYSFIRSVYATAYPDFLKLIGVSKKKLDAQHMVFANMLGYLHGRVYYRISNWYKVVDLIPGAQNRRHFEAMLNPVKKTAAIHTKKTDIGSLVAIIRFLFVLFQSERLSRRFKKQFAERYASLQQATPGGVNAETIYANIQYTKRSLLALWAAPVLNDVRVMIFHGLLKKRLLERHGHAMYLQYLQGLTDRASIEPLKQLGALGDALRQQVPGATTVADLKKSKHWNTCLQHATDYSTTYAARTPDELKLESIQLSDSLEDILTLALNANRTSYDMQSKSADESNDLPKLDSISRFLAKHARKAIDWRERFRFNRAQVFRLASDAYVVLGMRLADEAAIASPRDIFYLTEQEIEEIINGHAWKYDATKLVAERKRDFKRHEAETLSLRVSGRGKVAAVHLTNEEKQVGPLDTGMGVSSGVVSGEVIVVTKFDPRLPVAGKILIVTHIDPGWTLLFTQAAGVITERGNALSHVAIVARELHIPAIVAVPQATTHYATGDFVIMNGTTGEIQRETHKKTSS